MSEAEEQQTPAPAVVATVTEKSMADALVEARGDIFIAAQLLKITAVRLDRAIRVSAALQGVVSGIQDVKETAAYEAATTRDFERAIARRTSLYRVAGMDALYELASMPIDANSAQNQVKLAAAARLAGPTEGSGAGGELAETLRALNDEYQRTAPKIRVTRTTTIEIGRPENVVEGEAVKD